MRRFIAQHSSVVFLGALVLLALTSLWGGVNISQATGPSQKLVALFLMQLSGILFAAAVTTVFFAFPDVRRHLGETLASLFSEGEVVGLLSATARERLWRSLLTARLQAKSVSVQDSLERRVRSLLDSSLSEFHRYNVVVRMNLSRCDGPPGYLLNETVSTFRVRADHIGGASKTFHYQYLDEVAVHPGVTLERMGEIVDFKVRLGDAKFSREELRITPCAIGGVAGVRFIFEKEVPIDGEIDVEVFSQTYVDARDFLHAVIVRYPTYGLSLTLTYDDLHSYECVWFSADDLDGEMYPGRQSITVHTNGLTAYTQGWVLPGDGVVLSRTPKEARSSDGR